jgi:hypothetical protein
MNINGIVREHMNNVISSLLKWLAEAILAILAPQEGICSTDLKHA